MVIGTLRGLRTEHHDLQAITAVAMAAATMTTPNRCPELPSISAILCKSFLLQFTSPLNTLNPKKTQTLKQYKTCEMTNSTTHILHQPQALAVELLPHPCVATVAHDIYKNS